MLSEGGISFYDPYIDIIYIITTNNCKQVIMTTLKHKKILGQSSLSDYSLATVDMWVSLYHYYKLSCSTEYLAAFD